MGRGGAEVRSSCGRFTPRSHKMMKMQSLDYSRLFFCLFYSNLVLCLFYTPVHTHHCCIFLACPPVCSLVQKQHRTTLKWVNNCFLPADGRNICAYHVPLSAIFSIGQLKLCLSAAPFRYPPFTVPLTSLMMWCDESKTDRFLYRK